MRNTRTLKRAAMAVLALTVACGLALGGGFAVVNGYADPLLPAEAVEMVSQFMQKEITQAEMGIVDERAGTYDLISGQRVTIGTVADRSSLWRNPSQKGGTAGWVQKGQHVLAAPEAQDGFYEIFSLRGDSLGWLQESRFIPWDEAATPQAAEEARTIQQLSGYGLLVGGTQFESPFDGRPMTLVQVSTDAHQVKAWAELDRNGAEQHEFMPGEFAFAMESPLPDRAYMLSLSGEVLGYSSLGTLDDVNGRVKRYFLTDGDAFDAQVQALEADGRALFDPDKAARQLGEAQDAIDGYVRQYTEPLRGQINGLETEKQALEGQVAELTEALAAAEAEAETLREEAARLQAQLDEAAQTLAARDARIEEMQEEAALLAKDIESLQLALDKAVLPTPQPSAVPTPSPAPTANPTPTPGA